MRLLRYKALKVKVPLSKAQIDRKEAAGTFPKRVHLGPSSVAWVEDEIDAWLAELVSQRDGAKPPELAENAAAA